ncbi:anaphase-promoting complex, cyclosome, subunit 4 domain-containing protein [Hirsutella rhossiliensis]|uniref:Anaphase-promoting complex subunit 4 n=1 Tax=Hirsutella rhossiliensis TaxID=111463 RepID=A0A9P8MSP8_9HYPO|nr:anaphase-promoting complex, cyclosome, subunit 4 domain-containing protein [Hirsutella rhossiliensis]KAH0960580.1 anaphase-promoting complex, cyclosome, subunit 4 domain-containing protein [Hirsutella rhossiliensis]
MDQAKQLSLFSDNEFESRAPHGFPVGCPTLDVATTWDSGSKNLFIYRPPGQVVSKIHQISAPGEAAPEAVAVTWKPDGQFLAVGWSDGVVRLMGLENNKAAHHIPVCEKSETSITHIGWASSTISNKTPKSTSGRLADSIPEDWAHQGDQLPANLPLQLKFLEVDTALPKISPLPASSAGADEDATVFTLRTGIEFLFQPPKPDEYDKVNVMVVGTSDGKLQLSIHDSFIIGAFQCPAVSPSTTCQMIRHASHPNVSTHALVLADKATEPEELHLLPMDLPFISSSPINLSLLASKLTTLQKLLRYLKQTQLHMLVEWKNARELPSRFLRSVEGDLEEMQSGPRGIVPALYHTVVTGHAYGPVREWLVDSLAERGHKRWDKAVVSGLENIRSLVHENFLPALERCAIILGRLRGLAQFHDDRDDIGFSVMQIGRVLDIIGCLTLVGHRILTQVMEELDHFSAFSVWLRFQIDRLATSAGEELGEKEATMDNSKVLTYIEKYLTGSPLGVFFDDISRENCSADWDHCEDGPSLLQMLDRQLQRREEGQLSMKALPQVDFLVNYMTSWCSRIFRGIAESKKRSVRFGKSVRLSIGRPISNMDVKVCEAEKGGIIYTALASKGDDAKVHILRARIDIVNGISANQPATRCCVDLGDRQLVDFKFLNDKNLVVLCNQPDHVPVVISIPVQSNDLLYAPLSVDRPDDIGSVSTHGFAKYRLPVQQTARPVRMEVHDRSDVRGEIPERICLLGSNRTTWQTFSMPHHNH